MCRLLIAYSILHIKACLGWRDGSVVKSTDCSSRGPEFNPQQPHGGSQPSVMGANALFWCVWGQQLCTHIHIHHSETAPPGDPSHIQSPNPDTIVDAKKCLLTGLDIAVSWEALPVPDKYRGGCLQPTTWSLLLSASMSFYACVYVWVLSACVYKWMLILSAYVCRHQRLILNIFLNYSPAYFC